MMSGRSGFRILILTALLAAGFVSLLVWLVLAGYWPAAVVFAVPTASLLTRVAVLFLMRRRGLWPDGRPAGVPSYRYVAVIFVVQFVGWSMAAVYFLAVHFWLGLIAALLLAYLSFAVAYVLRARSSTTHPRASAGELE